MVRITLIGQSDEEVVLKVEGWVCGGNVGLLEQEGRRYLGESSRLVLDLSGVQFIDQAGIGLLQRWQGGQLRLQGGSPFVREMLKAHGLGQGETP